MDDKQYKKLSDYLNGCFNELEKNNSFLLENIYTIAITSYRYNCIIESANIESDILKNYSLNEKYISLEKVFSIGRQIVESIDKNYLNDYNQLINSGELDFKYDEKYYDSNFECLFENNRKIININRQFNYNDIVSLVHEYMHYTNKAYSVPGSGYLLTEFLSIYFEQYAIDYLLKNKDIKDYIGLNERYISTKKTATNFTNYSCVLLPYWETGKIDSKSIEVLDDYNIHLNKEIFDIICENMIVNFDKIKKQYEMDILFEKEFNESELNKKLSYHFSINYNHILGTILATYELEHANLEDMVNLNNRIINKELHSNNLFEIFRSIGIDFENENFFEDTLISVQKRLSKTNRVIK